MAAKAHKIGSICEVRRIIKDAETYEETARNDARQLWRIVSNTGGHGVFLDVDLLAGKDESFHFVQQKLEELRRLVVGSDKRIGELVAVVDRLEAVLGAGGPGLPSSYDPKAYCGANPYMDVDQYLKFEDMPMLPETTEDPERGVLTTYTMFECLSLLAAMAEEPYIGEVMCWLSEDRLLR
ncbi:uncharacterized protein LOC112880397 isoform X4 [Panicum hallii]|uniref:uncharacterized protein LOC112880397 isoform X4 n=1 Tax=Panicum hallii TaxID=206008 RepID=UPI000DF4E378|nr:uncharacterized protein LOC112880397 isoform X4 [Panicum hallii]